MATRKKPTPPSTTEPVIARLACGCRVTFRAGVEGSPVAVVLAAKGPGCPTVSHVAGLPVFDHREALRPATRPLPPVHSDYEEN